MSEDKEFDKYIKGLFEKSPNAPAELSWDKMDIEIPKAKKKKKYGWIFFLSVAFAFMVSAGLYFGKSVISNDLNHTKDQLQRELSSEISSIPGDKVEDISNVSMSSSSIPTLKESIHFNEQNSNKAQTNRSFSNLSSYDSKLKYGEVNLNLNQAIVGKKLHSGVFYPSISSEQNEHIQVDLVHSSVSSDDIIRSLNETVLESNNSGTSKRYIFNLSNNSTGEIFLKGKTVRKTEDKIVSSTGVSLLPTLNLNFLPPYMRDKSSLKMAVHVSKQENTENGIDEFVVGYSLNKFSLSIDPSNILKDKVNVAYGKSFQAGLRWSIDDDWKLLTLFRWNQYHSTFEHVRDLETEINIQNFRMISRKELTFHNNYTDVLEFQFGIERGWAITQKLDAVAGLRVSPSYLASISGKTLVDSSIRNLAFGQGTNRLILVGAAHIGLRYPLTSSMDMEVNYQMNKTLLSDVVIGPGVFASRQNLFTVLVSYKL